MVSFSIRRAAHYARHHYVKQSRNYLALLLCMLACPMLAGALSRSLDTAVDIGTPIYVLGGLAFALRTTYPMRNRGYKIMECALPVSNEERFAFMLFNLVVVFPLMTIVATLLSMVVIYPLCNEPDLVASLHDIVDMFFVTWPLYAIGQIVASGCLLVNLLSRSSLVLGYVIAYLITQVFNAILGYAAYLLYMNNVQFVLSPSDVKMIGACIEVYLVLQPIALYALSYWALRKRQMKW